MSDIRTPQLHNLTQWLAVTKEYYESHEPTAQEIPDRIWFEKCMILLDHISELQAKLDEAEIEFQNQGAVSLAMQLLKDDGQGVMSPGPCADLQQLLRNLKAKLDEEITSTALAEVKLEETEQRISELDLQVIGKDAMISAYEDRISELEAALAGTNAK